MSISAMKQALEALESWQKTCLDCGRGSEELGRATQPIAALRQAIAEAEKQEPVAFYGDQPLYAKRVHAIDISQEPVDETAKREHEPVAWVHRFIEGGFSLGKKPADLDRHPDRWQPLYADPTPCKTCEALAMSVMADHVYHEQVCPKREWVGLTDEEIMEVVDQITTYRGEYMVCVGNAIEARLKEKNT